MHEYLVHLWSTYEPHPQQKLSAIVHQTWWYTRNGMISIKELPQMSNLSKHKMQIPNYTAPANSSTGMRTSQRVIHCWYCMFTQYKSKTVHALFVAPHTSTLSEKSNWNLRSSLCGWILLVELWGFPSLSVVSHTFTLSVKSLQLVWMHSWPLELHRKTPVGFLVTPCLLACSQSLSNMSLILLSVSYYGWGDKACCKS